MSQLNSIKRVSTAFNWSRTDISEILLLDMVDVARWFDGLWEPQSQWRIDYLKSITIYLDKLYEAGIYKPYRVIHAKLFSEESAESLILEGELTDEQIEVLATYYRNQEEQIRHTLQQCKPTQLKGEERENEYTLRYRC